MKLPNEIKVGGIIYTAEVDQDAVETVGAAGMIKYDKCVIKMGTTALNAASRIR